MRNYFLIILIPFLLTSCDYLGSGKVKNLIDLTPKLEVEKQKQLSFKDDNLKKKSDVNPRNVKAHSIAKGLIISKPAFAKNIIYSADQKGFVSAFSLKEKKLLWSTDIAKDVLDRNFIGGGVLYSDGRLYITHGSRDLVILDAASGVEIIRKEFPDILRSKPAMVNDHVLVLQTISNQLIAYDTKNSKFLWMHEGGIETISTLNHVAPMAYDGNILLSYSSGEAFYLAAENGKEKWRYNLTESNNRNNIGIPSFDPAVIVTEPVINDEYAYFATSNGKIVKIDLDNGAPAWVKDAEDVQSLSLVGDYLFITNNARQVAALDSHDGAVVWVGDLISKKERSAKTVRAISFQAPFIVKDGSEYVINVIASNGELYQFRSLGASSPTSAPEISKIASKVQYHRVSCCTGEVYLITDRNIMY